MADFRLARSIRRKNKSYFLRDNDLMRGYFFATTAKLKRKLTQPKWFSSEFPLPVRRNKMSAATSNDGRETIEEAWQLVQEAKNKVIFDPNHRDAVLVVGNTGTGKSTLVQFIAGDMSKMWAVEYPEYSGNIIIQDEDGKISRPGEESTSKTLYPELVVSTKKDIAFYDCPGFKDSRGTAVDLAGAYMTKMVFENLENIKVHITVEWETAIGQNGRGIPFIEAIERVGEFIRDAEKFKDGLSMVATKVPKVTRKDDSGNIQVVPDEMLIKSVGDFIVKNMIPDVKKKIEAEKNGKRKKILENALVIFTALSKPTNGKYSRISLFRKPEESGHLDQSPLMQKSHDGIVNAIKTETSFMAVSTDDFGMSIADKTKLEMRDISDELNNNILIKMKEIGELINADVDKRVRKSVDWVDLIASLTEILEVVTDNSERLKKLDKFITDFVDSMQSDLAAVDIAISAAKFQAVEDDISYLDFVEAMLEEDVGTVPYTALDDSVTLITNYVAWYKILYTFLEALSADYIQEDTTMYNVANLDDWGQSGKPQGLRVSTQTFERFAKLLKIETTAISGLKLNEERMNELNSVVKLTLATTANIVVESDGTLLAQGPFVRLSKVLEEYKKNERNVKAFNVNASCAVYIDTPDFTAPGCHMAIAAPQSHIVGAPSIHLDGKDGKSELSPAEPGKGETPGENGVPGGAGEPAGHFIGVAHEVHNAKYLTISAIGGNGGKGQDGGKGGKGSKGYDARKPTDKWQNRPDGKEGVDWKQVDKKKTMGPGYVIWETFYDIFNSKAATNGMRGGDGGIGGLGGMGGSVILSIFEGNNSSATVRDSDGDIGPNGAGGKGGAGEKHGNNLNAKHSSSLNVETSDSDWTIIKWYDEGYSNPGSEGRTGGNDKPDRKLKPQLPVSEMAKFLIDFKGYILGMAAKTPLLRHFLEQFLREMNERSDARLLRRSLEQDFFVCMKETSDLNQLYDTSALLYEMNTLESLFYGIHNRINMAPYYQALLNRVRKYADEHKNETKRVEKLALGTIYSSCLSKLCSLQLEYKAQRRVNEIKEMDRRVAIKDFQKSYNQAITLKVNEANELIASKVNPGIDKSMRGMDDALETLVNETLKKLEEVEATVEELKALRAQMEMNVFIHGFLNLLNLGGIIASFCGPIGAAVGTVVTAGTTIVDSLVVDPDMPAGSAILLPEGLETSINGLGNLVVSIRDRKIEELDAQLTSTEKEIAVNSATEKENLKDLDVKVQELQKKLDVEKVNSALEDNEQNIAAQTERIDAIQIDLKDTIDKKETKLEEEIAAGKTDKKNVLDIVKKIKNGVKLVSASFETFDKFKDDQKKLDAISEALREADEAIMALHDYERIIYTTLFPMVRNMRDDMHEVMNSLSGKSQVALDVTKWEVQSTLNGIKTTLEMAMEGFDAQSELTSCFDQLSEALSLLIHIYDRLENYHDQQALGDYIANIGAAGDYEDLLRGTSYEQGVRQLDMTIQSNLVLLEYENSMNAFKQWVFPFARSYLEASTLPESLKPVQDEDSLREMVVVASKQLKQIKDHITQYWATIPANEKFFFTAKFYSNEKLGGPFYIWTKEHHKKEIEALFKGDEITLLADVRKSEPFVTSRRAIKFALIYLRFLLDSSDEARKAKFEDVLEYFVVNMVYTGVNYYEFQDQIYVINGVPITLSYGIKRDSKGEPEIISTSRDKLLNGDLLLSPFGLWTVKLTADRKEAFQLIKEFVGDVSLELAGKGKYIYDPKDELAALDLRPQDYYQVDGGLKDWRRFSATT
ncbi:uncharacterized protein LOC119085138 isoform X2 [Bradysia coprophila]|uniref:uncharacterized protein LOC119085138 isoform X2 n=1 Tax=Bradysia coprophila TaxID=38358 RepID=UPI00187DD43B|nr:uncharacterized protein LOC119085138 isoform X2 [Bradysia coprophila]